MFRLERFCLHLSVAHDTQLICDQGQDPLSIPLRGIAAFAAVPADLFELVVQVFNRVFSLSGECF